MTEQSRSLDIYRARLKLVPKAQKRYRQMGLVMFCIACGVLVVRIIAGQLYDFFSNDTVFETLFSIILQMGVLLLMPTLFFLYYFKMKPKEILSFSSIRKTQWFNYLLAIALGIGGMIVTTGISFIWQNIIANFGYTHSSNVETYPEKFNFLLFLLSIFTTAILPGVCEEFAMRGGLLTTIRGSFTFSATVGLMGLAFGLFHQNITQVFYTACFGALATAIVLKTRSIFPAIIMHFFNNASSVYLGYAEQYGWWGQYYFDNINFALQNQFFALFLLYAVICLVYVGVVVLMWYLNGNKRLNKKKEVILDSGFDVTHGRVVLLGNENKELVKELNLDKEVYGKKLDDELFRPKIRDNIFYIGAIVVASLTTLFTFIWGWIV